MTAPDNQNHTCGIHFTSKCCYWHSFCEIVTSSLRTVATCRVASKFEIDYSKTV